MNNTQKALLLFLSLLLASFVALGWSASRAYSGRELAASLLEDKEKAAREAAEAGRRLAGLAQDRAALTRFLAAWETQVCLREGEKGAALALRSMLEDLAQKKLGLVTDQLVAPEPSRVYVGKRGISVQRVSLRASGDAIHPLLVWLGEVESRFPFARVEFVEIQPSAGACSLRLGLAQALELKSQGDLSK